MAVTIYNAMLKAMEEEMRLWDALAIRETVRVRDRRWLWLRHKEVEKIVGYRPVKISLVPSPVRPLDEAWGYFDE